MEQLERFRHDGYLVISGALAGALTDVRRRTSPDADPDPAAFVRWNKSGKPVFMKVPQLSGRDTSFASITRHSGVLGPVESLLGRVTLFRDVLVVKPPEVGSAVRYHQDTAYWDTEPDRVISAWIPLDDVPESAGCLQVLPGSHRRDYPHGIYAGSRRLPESVTRFLRSLVSFTGTGDNPRTGIQKTFGKAKALVLGAATRFIPALNDLNELRIDPDAIDTRRLVSIPVMAGDVILFHGRLVHASKPNVGESVRRAYIVTYVAEDGEAGRRAAREAAHGKMLARTGQRNWLQDSWVGQERINRRVRLMRESTGMGPGTRVLELGSGTGSYTRRLAATGADVTAIDISPDLMAVAGEHLRGVPNARLELGNAETLEGIPDASFDIVVGNGILHHLDARRALASIFRVLKPGGRLAFVEPNMLNPQVALIKNVGWLKKRYDESPDETAYFRWQMTRYLADAGFARAAAEPVDFMHPGLSERSAKTFGPFLDALERLPLVREIAGALFITAVKPRN